MPLVYEELRRRAQAQLRRERPEHTLQPTALVHEVYVRLVDQLSADVHNRAHFLAIAAQMMRRILVDYARRRRYAKRGGDAVAVTLHEALALPQSRPPDLIALDEALSDLAKF